MTPHDSVPLRQQRLHRPAHSPLRVSVAVSPTHVHLTAATIEELFCDRYRLHEYSPLGQPALYEAGETVSLIGPRGHLDHVRVIGPPRAENQVELSSTDAQILGISVPVRRSGDLVGTPGIVIKGPRTSVKLERGVIRALRHVHMSPADAEYAGVRDGDLIEAVIRAHRPLIRLRGVLIRVSPEFRLELHLDSDEAKALGLKSSDQIELQPRARRARTE
jgi:propanediol utilization protein